MIIERRAAPRPGVRLGLAVGALGVLLYVGAVALEIHASEAVVVDAGERVEFTGPGPAYVVGAGEGPASCTVTSPAETETVRIGSRPNRLESIPAGRRLRVGDGVPLIVACDRRVAVATGPPVVLYPLAGSNVLVGGYFLVAILGFAYAWHQRRSGQGLRSFAATAGRSGAALGVFAVVAVALAAVGTMAVIALSVLTGAGLEQLLCLILPGAVVGATLVVRRWFSGQCRSDSADPTSRRSDSAGA